jgi:hypothetical protein
MTFAPNVLRGMGSPRGNPSMQPEQPLFRTESLSQPSGKGISLGEMPFQRETNNVCQWHSLNPPRDSSAHREI